MTEVLCILANTYRALNTLQSNSRSIADTVKGLVYSTTVYMQWEDSGQLDMDQTSEYK